MNTEPFIIQKRGYILGQIAIATPIVTIIWLLLIYFGVIVVETIIGLIAIVSILIIAAIYFAIPHKVILTESKIEYWFGRKKNFEARWEDVILVENGMGTRPVAICLKIKTKYDVFGFTAFFTFSMPDLIMMFKFIESIQKSFSNIEILDDLGWSDYEVYRPPDNVSRKYA